MSGIVGTSHSKSKVIGKSRDTAKAWANIDGTGTPHTNQSFNVSSISDNGAGYYGINFTEAMKTTTYCVTTTTQGGYNSAAQSYVAGSFHLRNGDSNWTYVDLDYVCCVVYEN